MCETKEELDTRSIAWEIYRLMYATNFNETFETNDRTRKHIGKISFIYNGKSTYPMNFSGETDFNFGDGWAHTRYEKYMSLIEKASVPQKHQEYKTMYVKRLNICRKLYKSVANISIMPQTGNLQSVKKGIGNDRIDTFIWALDEYYNGNCNIMMNYCTYENMDILRNYLDVFGDVNNYCNAIYHINESLVDDLIMFGKEPIDSIERMVSYMNLAFRFWRQKIVFLKNNHNQSPEIWQAIEEADNFLEEIFV